MRLFKKSQTLPMKDQLINFFNSIDYKFQIIEDSEDKTVFKTGVILTIGNADGYLTVNHKLKLVELFAHSPLNIPENKRKEVSKYMDLVDSITYIGNFQLNHDQGDIRCKTYFQYTNEPIAQEIINDNFFEVFNLMERFMPGIMSIVYGAKDADTALNEIIKRPNPTDN